MSKFFTPAEIKIISLQNNQDNKMLLYGSKSTVLSINGERRSQNNNYIDTYEVSEYFTNIH